MPPESYYTKTGRGYPDLAAVSNHYWVVNNMVPVPGKLTLSSNLLFDEWAIFYWRLLKKLRKFCTQILQY